MGDGARSWGTRAAARPHVWAAALLAACVFAYLWPVLVGGKLLSPGAFLFTQVPWSSSAPHDLHRYLNPVLNDLPRVDYPWRLLMRSFIHHGTFPAWNPYALGGIPLYSNPQTGLFSPFNLPLWILPLRYAMGVTAALKLLAGGFGTYLLARQLRLGFPAGLLAGVVFAFSAINITWLAHETLPGVVVTLPWALWLVERIFERARIGSAIALAGVVAIGLGGGHPGMQVHLFVATGAYVLVRAACSRGARPVPLRALALVAGGLAAGALLMAVMLIPETRAADGTIGVLARHTGDIVGARMPRRVLATVAFPDWWGRPSSIEAPLTPANAQVLISNYNERTFYAGAVALLLAGVGLVAPGGWRRKAPFAIVGLLGLAVAIRVPGLAWLVTHLPVLDSVSPQRLHFAFELGVAVLAGFGLQAVLDAPAGDRRRLAVVLGALAVGAIAVVSVGASGADVSRTLRHFATGASYARADVLELTSAAWFLLLVLGAGALLLLARRRPGWRGAVAVGLLLLALLDAFHFVHGYQPMGPAARVYPGATPAIAYLQRHRDAGRVAGMLEALPPDAGLVYGLRDVRGYDPPFPTTRMLSLWRIVNPAQLTWAPFTIGALDPSRLRVLGALGVRYIVVPPGARFSRRRFPQLTTVYDGADATVIANAAVSPRAFVPRTVEVAADAQATGASIAEAGFDPRMQAAVERDQPGAAALAAAGAPVRGTAAIVEERNARVTLEAQLDRRGLVVLGDQLTPGWSVRVDGRPATPLHVDGVMRGVIVPAGRHALVWSYTVPGLKLGAALSAATLALLAGAAVALGLRARRRPAGVRARREREKAAPMLRA
jgi:hypothetical protein